MRSNRVVILRKIESLINLFCDFKFNFIDVLYIQYSHVKLFYKNIRIVY